MINLYHQWDNDLTVSSKSIATAVSLIVATA